nr:aminoacyl tRNA synthase complex-interacting multifunctional protein 2-like isoform X3 [Procambarus clarkii]
MTTMYRMPRLVETPPTVELPSCMYKMEVLSCAQALDLGASYYGPSRVPSSEKNSDGVAALEVRQEALLERLQHLRQQLDHLLGNKVAATQVSSRSTFHPAIGAAAYSSPFKAASVHDLVISANPTTPPFSLVLLRKLLREAGCSVYSANHVHSSVSEVSDYLQECFTDQPLVERSKHKVAFTLHWKDVSALRLMVNPLHQTQISGEENIIRYVSRLFPLSSPFNYEASGSFAVITETDQLLDQVSKQVAAGNNKERQAAMRQLNGRLGKTEWLMGNLCGIADVLAWSLVKQAQLDVAAPANVAKWYKKMSTLAGLGT